MTRPTTGKQGYRVGIAGASSLLGQELLRVLKDRDFPVSHLTAFESDQAEPDLPVLDLSDHLGFEDAAEEIAPGSLDVLFLATHGRTKSGEPPPISKALEAAGLAPPSKGPSSARCLVIDSSDALGDVLGGVLSVPSVEEPARATDSPHLSRVFVSPHPAVVALSRLLLSLAERFAVKTCVAHVYFPVSEMGPRAIEELQKQTVNLLSFQKIPEKVFGTQLAFNLLARLPGRHAAETAALEARIRRELHQYLRNRVPAPALAFCQAAVFYSLAFSVFVEFARSVMAEEVSGALAEKRFAVRRRNEAAPSQVEAAGSGEILVDAITLDPDYPRACWIWAAVDNIRLAAENAVDIAETLLQPHRARQ